MTPLQINFFLESAAQISSIYEPNKNQQQPPDLTPCYLYLSFPALGVQRLTEVGLSFPCKQDHVST